MSREFNGGVIEKNNASFVSSGSHTVCCWVYLTSAGSGADGCYADISTNGSQNSQSFWVGINSSNQWQFQEDGGTYSFSTAATTNTWTHLALTFDGTSCRSYINGVLQNTAAVTLTPSRSNFQYFDAGFGIGGDFHVQDIMVFNAALSAAELLTLTRFARPLTQINSLYLWWQLLPGAQTVDFSGKKNNATSDGSNAATVRPPPTIFNAPVHRRIWQPASSGGLNVAGAMASSSALSGSTQALVASTLAEGSALVGAAAQQQPVASALADSSALAGSSRALVLSALADVSVLTGAAIQTNAGAGALADGSALSGSVQVLASGALASSSVLVGAAVQQQPVASALASSSALAGTASTNTNVSGSMGSGSALAGAAVQQQPVAGALASSSALAGAAVQQQPVAGALASSSRLTGDTSATVSVAGALANSSALAGAAVQQNRAAGALANSSALAGTVTALASSALVDKSALIGTAVALVSGAAGSGSALAGVINITINAASDLKSSSALSGTAVGGNPVFPYVPSGWFDAGDMPTPNQVVSAHGPWTEDISLGGGTHSPWRNETTVGTIVAHGPWSET